MKSRILIYGAGAIGRGYIPWIFPSENFELSFVESDSNIRTLMQKQKHYITYRTKDNKYEKLVCEFKDCFDLGEERPENYDAVITAVGPRRVHSLIESLLSVECPIVLFENDSMLAPELRSITGKDNIYFGIPDVITSNTAQAGMLENDPLSIITEDGICFVEDGAANIGGNISYVSQDEIRKQWAAKLYIHNTPHCIAAYLGALSGKKYLHEGMAVESIKKIIVGAMAEMSQTVIKLFDLDKEFVDWYSEKELARFSNTLLYDPILRVAREPFRKLGLYDRLIGASQLALSSGVIPKNLILGTMAAFLYDEKNDEDFNIKILMNSLAPKNFLKLIINVQPHEALYSLIVDNWDESLDTLRSFER
jgi:mannitol-1-phosphate/altronate dehydrogenase